MDFNTISQFLTAGVFPMFLCVVMLYMQKQTVEKNTEAVMELKGLIERLIDALDKKGDD